ncbi:MAG: fatty acid hydroxylase [Ectothiorhodospiraceae bacterium]|nr:fatty acid hydroxylase [Ectothiorhodospiraceae bacterium]
MFKSDFAEFFSRVHWTVPLWLFVPFVGYALYRPIYIAGLETLEIIGLVAAGIVTWTLTEYVMHRFVFHFKPKSEAMKRFFWTFHGVHHDYPSDPLRLVMVPAVSLPLAALFFFLFWLIFGSVLVWPFMAGFIAGYLFYDITHYAVHHFPIKGKIFGFLREHHMRHHFQQPDKGYGVSSPFWDTVFRTELEK